MVRKLILGVSFVLLAEILPLSGKPFLIFHYKSITVMLAIFAMWATQPPISKKETLENKDKDKFSVLLIIIMSIFSVVIAVIDWGYFISPKNNVLFSIGGLIIIIIGIAFRFWAIQTLGKHFTPTIQIQDDHTLITSGPYAVVRHPSYLGAMCAIVGTSAFLNSLTGTIISFACMFYAYYVRISTEEKVLVDLFGKEYCDYQQRVKKLIPFIW